MRLLLILLAAAGGAYLLATGIYRVPTGSVGLVHRRFGPNHGYDPFKVRTHGGPGPQAATLKADRTYLRPRFLYRVESVPQTYVPPGTIGVVVAKAGNPPSLDRVLSRFVACDYFQDGRAFLLGGGQMGRQPGILPGGGYYDVNPHLFEVLTVDTIGAGRHDLTAADLKEIVVPEGQTGVVITLEGSPPPGEDDGAVGCRVPGHASFQFPWVFLDNGGQRGAQAETLGHGGVYRINPWFARVVLIPTRDLILEWTRKDKKPAGNYDAALDEIVVSVEGHWLRFDMTQTIRIPASAAPRLVGRFGEQETDAFGPSGALNPAPVQRFVEKVLGREVEGYFQGTAREYKVLDFIAGHNEVRLELEERVRDTLAEWGVEAVRTTLNEFVPVGTELEEFQRGLAAERDRRQVLEFRRENARLEADAELIRIGTERERRKLEVAALEELIRVLGRDTVAQERLVAELAKMNVPASVIGDAGMFLNYMPLAIAQDLISKALRSGETGTSSTPARKLKVAPDSEQGQQSPSTKHDDPGGEDVVEAG